MELLIISGRSGSGKSIVLRALEDLGYNCTDNLPIILLPEYINLFKNQEQIAIGIDARNMPSNLLKFNDYIIKFREAGNKITIIYLDADDSTLINRFSETRRRHPLTSHTLTLEEAILIEAKLLKPIADFADITIHTSGMSSHQLKSNILAQIESSYNAQLSILILSFGYKNGIPTYADYVFDIRCLPNPYWAPELRDLTGQDEPVINFLNNKVIVKNMYEAIINFTDMWIPHIKANHRSYLTIAVGCTGGQHRSVYMAELIAKYYKNDYHAQVRHRELSKLL
jgi:UPF0042 nucleotide-binding protein